MDRDLAALDDMLRHARRICEMRRERSLDEVRADDDLRSAILYHVIILGEAARRVSSGGRSTWPLPWPKVIGLRNIVVHEYDDVDLDVLWRIAEVDLPPLVVALEGYLELRRLPED